MPGVPYSTPPDEDDSGIATGEISSFIGKC